MESKVIVISHGSHSLRVGLASDQIPKAINNIIARRTKSSILANQLKQKKLAEEEILKKKDAEENLKKKQEQEQLQHQQSNNINNISNGTSPAVSSTTPNESTVSSLAPTENNGSVATSDGNNNNNNASTITTTVNSDEAVSKPTEVTTPQISDENKTTNKSIAEGTTTTTTTTAPGKMVEEKPTTTDAINNEKPVDKPEQMITEQPQPTVDKKEEVVVNNEDKMEIDIDIEKIEPKEKDSESNNNNSENSSGSNDVKMNDKDETVHEKKQEVIGLLPQISNSSDLDNKITALKSIQQSIKDTTKLLPLMTNDINSKLPKQSTIYNESNAVLIESVEPTRKKKKKKVSIQPGAINANDTGYHVKRVIEPLDLDKVDYCIGEDALLASKDTDNWISCQPMITSTSFNITPKQTFRTLLDELSQMWKYSIQRFLNISPSDLNSYGCVYIIPDFFDKKQIKEIANILFKELSFTSVLLYQESVCSLFGGSIGTGCVIDIGHQKISISCVDEGYLIPQSRIQLKYGGSNITKLLAWLLYKEDVKYQQQKQDQDEKEKDQPKPKINPIHKYYFPLKKTDLDIPYDYNNIESIKNEYLSLNLNDENRIKHCKLKLINEPSISQNTLYQFNGDDLFKVGAMSLFYPDALRPFRVSAPRMPDPEELFDDKKEDGASDRNLTLALDAAVYRSIKQSSDRNDVRKRFISNLFIVGGGSFIPGLETMLKQRLTALLTAEESAAGLAPAFVEKVRQDMDERNMCWKGGAILGCLESSREIWITRDEWKSHSSSLSLILREKLSY